MNLTRLSPAALVLALAAVLVQAPASRLGAAAPGFVPFTARGGLVYVSGILPPVPAAGDGASQAAAVLEELKARLAAAGTSMDRVVATSVYLSSASDYAAMNAAWSKYWPASPPARTTVVAQLPLEGARLQVSAVAAAADVPRSAVAPSGWAPTGGPFSYAVRAAGTVFLSGLVSRKAPDNALVTGDIETQTRVVLENAKGVLAAAGLGLTDVVSARIFVPDASQFDRMNAVYRSYFPADPPARATVVTPLVSPDYQVEITLIAVEGPGRRAYLTPNADGSPGRANPNLSSAIRMGPRLFLSGMLGVLPGNAADAAAQTAETLNRLERTMKAAEFAWPDVAESVVYVTDTSTAPAVMSVIEARTGGRMPAGTVIGTGLVSPEGRVEIMLTAGK